VAYNSFPPKPLSSAEYQREQILSWLAENVPESRTQHILRVEKMAMQLAQQHHLDVHKAATAGLLHDLAKYFLPTRLLEMAKAAKLELTAVDLANPHLLHADISAIIAAEEFGVTDSEILQAIANHTLGKPGMDQLSCVVFLADSIEPGRGNHPQLEAIRKICVLNLYQAVWMTCDRTLSHLIATGALMHPRMVLTRNWALQMSPAKSPQKPQVTAAH